MKRIVSCGLAALYFMNAAAAPAAEALTQPIVSFPRVVLLQDIHRNVEAQQEISRQLLDFRKSRPDGLIALEGAFGPLDESVFQRCARPQSVRRVADYLLRQNIIQGPMHALLTADAVPALAMGVDDVLHYRANVNAYRQARPRAAALKAQWQRDVTALATEKKRVYSSALSHLDDLLASYRNRSLVLGRYVQLFSRVSALAAPPTVADFLTAYERERALDFRVVEAERARLLEQLLERLSVVEKNDLRLSALAFQRGDVSHFIFYSRLWTLAGEKGIALGRFPILASYVDYLAAAERINGPAFFADLNAWERASLLVAARTAAERRLVDEDAVLWLTGKLLDFSLSSAEWAEYQRRRATIRPELKPFEDFYVEAGTRDEKMAENFLAALRSRHATEAVLVVGGFHSQGVIDRLTRAGATVTRWTPVLRSAVAADGSALGAFARQKAPLEKLVKGDPLFLAEPVAIQTAGVAELVDAAAHLESGNEGHDAALARFDWEAGVPRHVFQQDGAVGTVRFDDHALGVHLSPDGGIRTVEYLENAPGNALTRGFTYAASRVILGGLLFGGARWALGQWIPAAVIAIVVFGFITDRFISVWIAPVLESPWHRNENFVASHRPMSAVQRRQLNVGRRWIEKEAALGRAKAGAIGAWLGGIKGHHLYNRWAWRAIAHRAALTKGDRPQPATKKEIEESKRRLTQILTKPLDYDWSRASDLPALTGARFGMTNTFGRISIVPISCFPYTWNVVGAREAGWDIRVSKAGVVNGIYEMTVLMTKPDNKPITRVFQISGVRQLKGTTTRRGDGARVWDLDPAPGLTALAELIADPRALKLKLETGQVPSLNGLRLGKTNSGGRYDFRVGKNLGFRWNILGHREDWDGVVQHMSVKGEVIDFEVRFTKGGRGKVVRRFQIHPDYTRVIQDRRNEGKMVEVVDISRWPAFRVVQKLLQTPPGENFPATLPVAGLFIGVTETNTRMSIRVFERVQYCWYLVRKLGKGFTVRARAGFLEGKVYNLQATLYAKKKGVKKSVTSWFQLHPEIRQTVKRTGDGHESWDVPVISSRLGRLALQRLMATPLNVNWPEAARTDLSGLRIGRVRRGAVSLHFGNNFNVGWFLFGSRQEGYEAVIVKNEYVGGHFRFDVKFTKPGATTVVRTFQIGPSRRTVPGTGVRVGETKEVWDVTCLNTEFAAAHPINTQEQSGWSASAEDFDLAEKSGPPESAYETGELLETMVQLVPLENGHRAIARLIAAGYSDLDIADQTDYPIEEVQAVRHELQEAILRAAGLVEDLGTSKAYLKKVRRETQVWPAPKPSASSSSEPTGELTRVFTYGVARAIIGGVLILGTAFPSVLFFAAMVAVLVWRLRTNNVKDIIASVPTSLDVSSLDGAVARSVTDAFHAMDRSAGNVGGVDRLVRARRAGA